jgi:large subunit ribosomal protein L15
VQSAIDAGRLDGKNPITVDALLAAGVIRRKRDGVRLLGSGELKTKLAFEVTGASSGAIKAIEAQGGSVKFAPLPYASGKPVAVKEKKPKKLRGLKAKAAAAEAAKGEKKAKAAEAGEDAAEDAAPKKAKPEKAKKDK